MKKKMITVFMALCILTGCGSTQVNNTESVKKVTDGANAVKEVASEVVGGQLATEEVEAVTEVVSEVTEPVTGNAAGVADWHDTEEQIIQKEGRQPDERDGETNNGWIAYNTTLDNHDAYLYYYIDKDYGCYNINYAVYDFDLDNNLCKSEYDTLVSVLTGKYGEPISNEKEVLSSMAGVSGDDIDFSIGNIDYTARWELDNKDIQMWAYYSSEQNGMLIQISYFATDYEGQGFVNPDTSGL